FTIDIFTSPTINTAIADYDVCDDNNDGFSCLFDFNTKTAGITGGAPGLVVTYHETLTDSQTGSNPISLAGGYCNIVSGEQTIYVRVFDAAAPACASLATFQIRVNPVPVVPPVVADYALCDDNAPGDMTETFDLDSWIPNIVGSQAGLTVTFYNSQADALAGVSPIATPTAYTNT